MNTCSTCKHWRGPEDRTGFKNAIDLRPRGERPPIDSPEWKALVQQGQEADMRYGECSTIDLQDDWDPEKPLPLATTRDASDYVATLFTQPEFGCLMWEANP